MTLEKVLTDPVCRPLGSTSETGSLAFASMAQILETQWLALCADLVLLASETMTSGSHN